MTEIEQLRKDLNELRERIAVLEARPWPPISLMTFGGGQPLHGGGPQMVPSNPQPPWIVTCADDRR